jgi:hypothetical protein
MCPGLSFLVGLNVKLSAAACGGQCACEKQGGGCGRGDKGDAEGSAVELVKVRTNSTGVNIAAQGISTRCKRAAKVSGEITVMREDYSIGTDELRGEEGEKTLSDQHGVVSLRGGDIEHNLERRIRMPTGVESRDACAVRELRIAQRRVLSGTPITIGKAAAAGEHVPMKGSEIGGGLSIGHAVSGARNAASLRYERDIGECRGASQRQCDAKNSKTEFGTIWTCHVNLLPGHWAQSPDSAPTRGHNTLREE